ASAEGPAGPAEAFGAPPSPRLRRQGSQELAGLPEGPPELCDPLEALLAETSGASERPRAGSPGPPAGAPPPAAEAAASEAGEPPSAAGGELGAASGEPTMRLGDPGAAALGAPAAAPPPVQARDGFFDDMGLGAMSDSDGD
ncbi:unnamed protein product, partial [Prorocentrum cordatum]